MISEVFKTYSNFINQGGPVVFILFLISIYLFILIAAKFKFLFFEIDTVKFQFKKDYQNIKNDQYLSLNQSILKSDFKTVVVKDFYIIQTLIALCPVLGLLGTVTGMIEVFDVVSFFGTGNARDLASGITKATLHTITGIAIKKIYQEETGLDLTPMLDIVFIMLIFFIVTTSFVKESGIEVNRPNAETAERNEKGNILVAISENNEIYIDRRKVELRAIRPNIIRLRAENPEGAVIIQADKASQTGLLVEAMDQIRLAGVLEISIAAEND